MPPFGMFLRAREKRKSPPTPSAIDTRKTTPRSMIQRSEPPEVDAAAALELVEASDDDTELDAELAVLDEVPEASAMPLITTSFLISAMVSPVSTFITCNVTVNVPFLLYVWDGVVAMLWELSPKSHW